ncbi:MAG: glutamate synthase-related protein, partial [Alphaproteobacteria bacterium]
GMQGGTAATQEVFIEHAGIPTLPAVRQAVEALQEMDMHRTVRLIVSGGIRSGADVAKALALGADAVAVSNAAIQAIGCLGMRACHTNNCPVGIATQNPGLMARLEVEKSAQQLSRFFEASVELMKILARACGHSHLSQLVSDDLVTWKEEMTRLAGIDYGGVRKPA